MFVGVSVSRFCSTVLPKRSVVLFSKEGLEKDLPGRVSRVAASVQRGWPVSSLVHALHEEVPGC